MTSSPQSLDLGALAAFVRSAELGSFTGAAQQLGVTASGVSKAISRLEEGLGVRLFARTTRTIRLTHDGEAFFERCRQILADIADAQNLVLDKRSTPRGVLRVSAPVAFGRRLVVPRIARFLERFGEVSVHVSLADRYVDLVEEGFDAAIRIGGLPDTRLIARRVGEVRYVVCGAPDYFARHPVPGNPRDLRDHSCVSLVFPQTAQRCEWRFSVNGKIETYKAQGPLTVDQSDALVDAALAGAGLIYVYERLIEDEIARGALLPVLESYLPPPSPLHVVYPHATRIPGRVRALVDFLVADFGGGRKTEAPGPGRGSGPGSGGTTRRRR